MQDHLIIDSNYGKWYKSNNCENIWNMLFPLLSPMFSSFYFILINISSFFWLSENYFIHCVKIVQVRSYFWFVFPILGPNTGKYLPEITPYLDTFHAVKGIFNFLHDTCFGSKKHKLFHLTSSTAQMFSKQVFLKISPNSRENTIAGNTAILGNF